MQNSCYRLLLWLIYIFETELQIIRLCAKFGKNIKKALVDPHLKLFDKGDATY